MFDSDAYLSVVGVSKTFGEVQALADVSASVKEGDVVALLGPSGCGKTTLLRTIAGLEKPDSGSISLQGEEMRRVPASKRGIGMVFQNYALFPHLSVFDNVAFGLRMQGEPKSVQKGRVRESLEAVQLAEYEDRYPRQMSGGQQQRVALARALAIQPRLLLLDEPLSNLDARLRREVRLDLRALQQRLGITTVFVTHDQEEALALADRIIVMRMGQVEQVGAPREIYRFPATPYAASFVGETNLLAGTVIALERGCAEVRLDNGAQVSAPAGSDVRVEDDGYVVVRQEDLAIQPDHGVVRAKVEISVYLGSTMVCQVRPYDLSNGDPLRIRLDGNAKGWAPGTDVFLSWDDKRSLFLKSEQTA